MAFEQPFRIEISKDGKNITFGPRRPNETGRDILAIKIALGLVQTSDGAPSAPQGESNSESEVALDSQKWFDCGTGLGMDTKQASTYDSRLRNALVNYQIQNQFLIICYLIEKFGLRDLIGQTSVNTEFDILNSNIPKEYDQSLMKMVESSIILFDSELGLMGEATLAVLHGWVPHSTFTNTGYAHVSLIGQETVYDVIHIALARQLHSNFTQTYQEMVSAGLCVQGGFVYNDVDKLNQYLQYASDNTNWTRMRGEYNPFVTNREVQRFQYGVLEYVKKVPSETSSLLYSAAISVIDNSPVLTPNEEYGDNPQSSAEKIENLKRMYFPDPFTDPAPFDIDDDRVGYFLETEYQLKSDNLPSEEEDTIRDLEQKALEQVFDARGLPTIWYTNRSARLVDNTNEIENNNINYFGNSASPTPNHNGYYPYSDEFRSRSNFEAAIEFKKYYEYSELKRRFDFNVTARDKALEDFNEGNWLGRDETIHGAIYKSTGFIEEVELGSWSSPARSRGKIRNAYDNANAEITEAMLNWPTQEYNKESFYVLALKEDEAMISQGYAQHWREIDSVGTTELTLKYEIKEKEVVKKSPIEEKEEPIVEEVKIDSDKDGIFDEDDECPNLFGSKSANGCPDLDKDGVQDSQDMCPNTIGDILNNGCPMLSREDSAILEKAISNLEFDKNLMLASHVKHPSGIWCRETKGNYSWLLHLLVHLLKEYTHRYGKRHSVEDRLPYLNFIPKHISQDMRTTEMPQCMPEYCKVPGKPITAYKNYYINEKVRFATWKNRSIPQWYEEKVIGTTLVNT